MKKYLPHFLILVFLLGVSFNVVRAEGTAGTPAGGGVVGSPAGGGTVGGGTTQSINFKLDNPFGTKATTIPQLFKSIFDNILMPIGGVIAVLAFIWSGFLYVMAQGDEKKIQTANRALLYTAIGTAILLGSWVIFQVIGNTLCALQGSGSCPF
ncbi:MAG: protein of unknown function with transrane region [Parcubacteria group bacterium]|nr:protein of unknown function with transrane region [Parcubacteria group bacterium]